MDPEFAMRKFVLKVLLLTVLCGLSSVAMGWHDSRDAQKTLSVEGVAREYLLYVPASLRAGRMAPLVLVFHGGDGHARNMPGFTHFDRLADEQGFVVAYPEGVDRHWNDGRGLSPADDVGFIRAMIAELERTQMIDAKRVFAAGISNGGFFSQRLACELAGTIAAVASVAATIPEPLASTCKPAQLISVMFIQGTRDPLVPIDGGPVARTHGRCISLAAASSFWRTQDRSTSAPVSTKLPDKTHDGTHVRRDAWAGQQNTEVVVYTIEGGGHTWPGGPQYLPKLLVGTVSHNLDATEEIWKFFQKHSLP